VFGDIKQRLPLILTPSSRYESSAADREKEKQESIKLSCQKKMWGFEEGEWTTVSFGRVNWAEKPERPAA